MLVSSMSCQLVLSQNCAQLNMIILFYLECTISLSRPESLLGHSIQSILAQTFQSGHSVVKHSEWHHDNYRVYLWVNKVQCCVHNRGHITNLVYGIPLTMQNFGHHLEPLHYTGAVHYPLDQQFVRPIPVSCAATKIPLPLPPNSSPIGWVSTRKKRTAVNSYQERNTCHTYTHQHGFLT